jgi:hypothetical protein
VVLSDLIFLKKIHQSGGAKINQQEHIQAIHIDLSAFVPVFQLLLPF